MHHHVADPADLVGKKQRLSVGDDPLRPRQLEHVHQLEIQQVMTGLQPALLPAMGEREAAPSVETTPSR